MKHSTFDKRWDEVGNWCWKLAINFSRKYGGRAEDYIGSMALHLNEVLNRYNEEKGSLTCYLAKYATPYIWREWLKYETERRHAQYYCRHRRSEDKITEEQNYNFHESDYFLYRVPEDEWESEILDAFNTREDLWQYLIGDLGERNKIIMQERFRDGMQYSIIALRQNITKERVRQVVEHSLKKIREKIITLDKWIDLFRNNSTKYSLICRSPNE